MLEKIRAWRAQRKKRRQELDQELAAEERALIDDPDELGVELDQARIAGSWRRSQLFMPPDDKPGEKEAE
jgi:hypothetical protein